MRYNAITQRYFESAALAGILQGEGVVRGARGSRERGIWVQFDLRVDFARPDGLLQDVRFLCFGCPHTIAISAWVAEAARGKLLHCTLPESVQALSTRFEVPPEKLGRLLTVEDAWRCAAEPALARLGGAPP